MDYEQVADAILESGDRRSAVYRAGLIAVLKRRVENTPAVPPYAPGSVEFDAYFAGNWRGHHEWESALLQNERNRERAIDHLRQLAAGRRVA